MDLALGDAENNAQSSNSLNALTGLLGKVPGTRDLVTEAESLKHQSETQESLNRSRGSHMGYAQAEGTRASTPQPSSSGGAPGPGLQGMPDFNPQETVAKIYPILALDRKSTRLNSSHSGEARMPSSA